MRLITKLWIAVAVFLGIAFVGALLISLSSMRHSIEEQLGARNIDDANTIASVLTTQAGDTGLMEVALTNFFDRGHYARLRLSDATGKQLFDRASAQQATTPVWFRSVLPILSAPAMAQVMDGWKVVATIEVETDTAPALGKLWEIAVGLYFWISLMAVSMALALALLLKKVLKPLADLSQQASDISERKIREIPLPPSKDFLPLATSMNVMARRLKAIFEEESRRLDELRTLAYTDSLTGLSVAAHFRSRLVDLLESRDRIESGALFLLRINNLAGLNASLGRDFVDRMLNRLGQLLAADKWGKEALAGRLNGSDLALLIPGPVGASDAYTQLQTMVVQCCSDLGLDDCPVHAAYLCFSRSVSAERLLSLVEHSLAVESSGLPATGATAVPESPEPVAAGEWRDALGGAISAGAIAFSEFPVCSIDGTLMHHELVLRLQLPGATGWLDGGTVIPWVRQLGMEAELDLAVLTHAMAEIRKTRRPVAINMLVASLSSAGFVDNAKAILTENAEFCPLLSIEFNANGVYSHLEQFRVAAIWIGAPGVRLGIEHFGHHSEQIRNVDGLGVSYIKVDYSFVQGATLSPSHRSFLGGLCVMTKALGLQIIGEGIVTEQEWALLAEVGFDGVTGPAVSSARPL